MIRRLFILATGVLIVAAIWGGFAQIGSPEHQRRLRIDEATIDALMRTASAQQLTPAHHQLGARPVPNVDRPYDAGSEAAHIAYRRAGKHEFDLCTTFLEPSTPQTRSGYVHAAGLTCYRFDAGSNVNVAPWIEPLRQVRS